ncbi:MULTISPECIES: beta-ketoacyl-ACP synthase III [Idiomarina]|jgi:3-oxoacyl-[acyl-carrier-protein] synthase-3|uniref:Beta-ketoacyl-[acyl-carrier-protein] synthase III n=1 Tax=Idiomarina zobellii TaxID=86103 RepID=A0A837NEW4_9GAMM|nr:MULTISPECIES: beta-ketoacyl-ACP synthase III [Idiomarina]KPD23608.1 3-oxoacyl-ACP synthase [Idiomarina zobellii]MBF39846.1 ketoacyl-ACP synthase III [Idiomarinaceae bacterium]SDF92425.1 3-oxoacyl-[acyl-carrier-protein] synthase III [Idiomarina zobellii]|tara:strand:- start:37764 stop:38723 length:960 start_codon:yes stop_codon:yes gene_type:complete
MTYSRIVGTGHYLPEQRLTNDDLATRVDTSDEWITERTGIKERRIAAANESAATLGYEAAKQALLSSQLNARDIDVIVVATTSAEHAFPSAACEIQRMLDVTNIPAFDIGAACSGFIFALSVADNFIKTGQYKRALVIGTDVLARLCNPNDRNTLVLFGDGAGAVILEQSNEPGIVSTHLYSAGEYSHLLGAKQANRKANPQDDTWMYMKGNEVFKVAVAKLSSLVTDTLSANKMSPEELDWLVPHQANLRIIKATAKKLNMSMEQVVITLDKTGNTSAASVPIALDWAVKDGRVKRGQNLLLEAFGGGFAWGSALIRY